MTETLPRTHLLIGTSRCLELSGIQNVVEDVVVKLRSNGRFRQEHLLLVSEV